MNNHLRSMLAAATLSIIFVPSLFPQIKRLSPRPIRAGHPLMLCVTIVHIVCSFTSPADDYPNNSTTLI